MNIKQRRMRQGFSMARLAKEIGVARSTVLRWEAGTAKPSLDNLKVLAQALNTTIDELMDD